MQQFIYSIMNFLFNLLIITSSFHCLKKKLDLKKKTLCIILVDLNSRSKKSPLSVKKFHRSNREGSSSISTYQSEKIKNGRERHSSQWYLKLQTQCHKYINNFKSVIRF